jgi:succinylarginine dihydrolase
MGTIETCDSQFPRRKSKILQQKVNSITTIPNEGTQLFSQQNSANQALTIQHREKLRTTEKPIFFVHIKSITEHAKRG